MAIEPWISTNDPFGNKDEAPTGESGPDEDEQSQPEDPNGYVRPLGLASGQGGDANP